MMIKYILILSIIISCINCLIATKDTKINLINTENKDSVDCKKLANIFTFSSYIEYCYDLSDDSLCMFLKEDVIDGERGRLIIENLDKKTEIYYQNDSTEAAIINNGYSVEKLNPADILESNQFLFVYHDENNRKRIVGPSATLVTVMNSESKNIKKECFKDYRGMASCKCNLFLKKFMNLNNVNIDVIFEDPEKSIIKENKLIRLEIKSKQLGRQFFNYYNFTINKPSVWRLPAVGAALDRNKNLPTFIGTGIHEISLEHLNEDEKQIESIDVYYDRNDGLLRLDINDMNEKNILIYNHHSKAKYEIKNGICESSIVNTENGGSLVTNLKKLDELLDDIENISGDNYRYIGEEIVQDTKSDVFEYKSIQGNRKIIKLIYIKHEIDENDKNIFPIKYTKIIYEKLNEQYPNDKKYKIVSKYIYNLLNYKQLNYDQYYRSIFQTKYCHSDKKDNLYLTMIIESPKFNDKFKIDEQNLYEIKNDINNFLRSNTGLNFLQIPDLFLEFKLNKIKIDIIFEELVHLNDYFSDFNKFWISTQDLEDPEFLELDQCSKLALQKRDV